MKNNAWYAQRYIEKFGFHIVPIEPGRKFPKTADWGNATLSDPEQAAQFYEKHPTWNIGVALGPSRVCSLDIDNEEALALIFESYGLDLQALIRDYPTVRGRGLRVMFRVPDGVELPYIKLNWPSKNDPTGKKHAAAMKAAADAKASGDMGREARIRKVAKRWAMFTVFELRSADGKQRQDVLPPSMHPETKQPYVWESQPRTPWPEPPEWLLAIWTVWDKFKPQFRAVCPWAIEPEVPEKKLKERPLQYTPGQSAIQAYKDAIHIETALQKYGYTRKGKRWLSPHSHTGLPGVHVFEESNACYIHHASDPLCSAETGYPVNSFDLFCYYEHNGDIAHAVKAAAKLLGLSLPKTVYNAPTAPQYVDNETGEVLSIPPDFYDDMPPAGAVSSPVMGSRDIYTPLLWTTPQGKPKAHIDNLNEILRRLGVSVRYNVIKKEEEIIIPGQAFSCDNAANASLAWLSSECSLFDFPTAKLGDFITYVADTNLFNPVQQWIMSKPWDGTDRLADFFATITAKNESINPDAKRLKEILMLRWAISAVAAAMLPDGVSAAGVLVLQGDQYLGKTKWFKTLVPRELDLIKDGMLLRPDDKDSVKQCVSYWLVELGELDATFRRSDIAALKSFLTNDRDVLRRAFAKRESTYARRTVFFGSVNPREYLHDPTGNRRYWTIECESINHSHDLDMQQVWAQLHALFREGESFYLSPDEMKLLNSHNEDFTALDPTEERLETQIDWMAPQSVWRWMTATEVATRIGIDRPTKHDVNTVSSYVRKRNGGQARRTATGRMLLVPPFMMA